MFRAPDILDRRDLCGGDCGGAAKGVKLEKAVLAAKEFITTAIAGSVQIGRHPVLDGRPTRD